MKITIEYDKTSTDRPSMITVFKDGIELDPAVTSRYYTINGKWFSSPTGDDSYWIVPSELLALSEADFIEVLKDRYKVVSMEIVLEYPDRDGKGSYYIEAWAKVYKQGKCYHEIFPGLYYIKEGKYYSMGVAGSSKLIASNKTDFLRYLEGQFKDQKLHGLSVNELREE